MHRPTLRVPESISWIALSVIVGVVALPLSDQHPGIDAVIATLATTVLLFSRENWIPKSLPTDCAVKIGDWSYSIYLVHWPLFAFATTYFLEEAPAPVRAGLLALTIVLGWLQYRFVEQRFRLDRHRHRSRKAFGFGAATASVGALALALPALTFAPELRIARPAPNTGLSPECEITTREWNDPAECRRGDNPTIALWGDSFAMHWNPALADMAGDRGLVQITKSACAPLVGIAMLRGQYDERWAADCIAFNDEVVTKLVADPAIDTVILASIFTQVMSDEDDWRVYRRGEPLPVSIEAGSAALAETIATLQKAGKRVIVIEPTPSTGLDHGACALRQLSDRPIPSSAGNCSFRLADTVVVHSETYAALEQVAAEQGARYVRPRDVLCPNGRCPTHVDGRMLYRDTGHLTEFAARWMAARLNPLGEAGQISSPEI